MEEWIWNLALCFQVTFQSKLQAVAATFVIFTNIQRFIV